MRILVTEGLSANAVIRRGWINAFRSAGHEAVAWNPKTKPALDMFFEFTPQLFIGSTFDLDRATVKALAKSPLTKIVLNANEWSRDGTRSQFPIDYASDDEKRNVGSLRDLGREVLIKAQYAQRFMERTHGGWRSLGCDLFGLMLGADTNEFYPAAPNEIYRSDVSIVSGSWKYKNENLHPYLMPLAYPFAKLRLKLFGQGWGLPQSFGRIPDQDARALYASSLISANIYEPHSVALGIDVNSRLYQVPSSLGFQISQRVDSAEKDVFTNGEVVFVDSPAEFRDKLDHFQKNPAERIPYIERASDVVWQHHTSLHRAAAILGIVGFVEEANKLINIADQRCSAMQGARTDILNQIRRFWE